MQTMKALIFSLSLTLLFSLWITYAPHTTAQSNEAWQNYSHTPDIQDVLVKDGDIWMATRQAGVTRWNPTTNKVISYTADLGHLGSNRTNTLAADEAGHIWVGAANGLSEFNGQTWQIYTTTLTPEQNTINAIAIDANGQKWLATAGGLVNFDDGLWQPYTQSHGLVSDAVLSVAVDQDRRIWSGTGYSSRNGRSGVNEFDGQRWKIYTVADGLSHSQVNAIVVDQAGHKWFGTEGGGISQFDGSVWITYTAADGLGSNIIYDLVVDESGQIWAGTSGGVSVFDGESWTTYTTRDGLIDNVVKAIALDEAGHKWFGTPQGLSRFDDSRWMPSPPTLPVVTAVPVTETQSYRTWDPPHQVIDRDAERIYVRGRVDEIEKTVVLALADERLLATYDLAGDLGLDAVNGWLYVDQGPAGLAVINTRSERLHTVIPLPVQQGYNSHTTPVADSTSGLVMVARDNVVYVADPGTGLIVDTLATDVINDVRQAASITRIEYDDTARLLYLENLVHSCHSSLGGSCSTYAITSYDMAAGTEITRTLTSDSITTAVGGYLVRSRLSCPGASCNGRRSVWRNGEPWLYSTGWKDWGGPIDFDPARQRFYEMTDTHLRVYDAETMALTMYLTRPMTGAFEGYNPQTDALQFRPDGVLQQWPVSNIRPPEPEPLTPSPVPTTSVVFVAPSPDWPADQTLFAAWSDPTYGRYVETEPTGVNRQFQCDYSPLLYISDNNDQTWGRPWGGIRGSCGLGTALAVSPNYSDDQTLLAGLAGLGVFKSTDGGELWQPSGAGLTHLTIQDILLSPNFAADTTAFAVSGDYLGREVYRSTDGGAGWQSLKLPFEADNDMLQAVALSPEFDQDQTLMAIINHRTAKQINLYRSDDAGNSWQFVSQLPAETLVNHLALAPLFAKWQTLFMLGSNQTLYRSTDGGHSWSDVLTTDIPNASMPQIVFAPGIEENRPVFLLSGVTLYRSNDGGATWHSFETPDDINPTALAVSPNFAQDRTLLIGTADGRIVPLVTSP